jgi:hypothetical protein
MFQRDYQFGIKSEKAIKPTLENYFKEELTHTKLFTPWDFTGKNNVYEVKTRRIYYKQFPTTIIPQDKARPNAIFVFNFIDGVYYIPYDEEQFKEFDCKEFRRYREGVNDIEKPYYYIPIDRLTKIQ